MAQEVEILQKFMRTIDSHPDQAQYGYFHVQKASERGAVAALLVTDELFRSAHDAMQRKKYVQLVEDVRNNGGKVYIFSSLHVSGTQLQQVSGVAAILRFPLPDLADLEEDGDDDDDDSQDDRSRTWSSSSYDSEEETDDRIERDQTLREAEEMSGMGL
jgi:protein pelota